MEDKNIREYARLMQELGLTGLEIRKDGSLRLERGGQPAGAGAPPAQAPAAASKTPDGLFEVRDRSRTILDADLVPPAVEAALVDGRVDPDHLIGHFAGCTDQGWRDDVAVLVVNRGREADA